MSADWRRRKIGELRVVTIHHEEGTQYNRLMLEELVSDFVAAIEGFYRNPPWGTDGSAALRVTHATVTKLTIDNASWWTHEPAISGIPEGGEEIRVLWASPEQEAKWRTESNRPCPKPLQSNEAGAEKRQDDTERN